MLNRKVLFLDMDGVIVDFFKGMKKITGKDPPKSGEEYNIYLMDTPIEPFDYDFWFNLDKTPEADMIINHAIGHFGLEHIIILSKPIKTRGCRDAKEDWIAKHYPDLADNVFLGKKKWKLASATNILLDDHNENHYEFIKHGGRSVLFPRPWNDMAHVLNPLHYVFDQLTGNISEVAHEYIGHHSE